MDVSGPRALSSLNALSKPEAGLRPFQRVTAQVLDVTGTTAVLSIDGHPIVAQLTSAAQATALLTQQTAQFIVTQLTNQKITLKMIKNEPSETVVSSSPPAGAELALRVLEQNKIPATINNLMMARSVLKQHLPITNDLLNELIEILSEYGSWGSQEADLAAALKAAGLPVTAQSITLVSHQPAKISDSISQLIKSLNDMASPDLPDEILKQLELNMWLLNGLVLDGDEETSRLAKQLRTVSGTLGKSLENILLEQSQDPESTLDETGLLSLVRLQKGLEQIGKNEAAESIGKFLEDVRWNQFLNAKPEWAEINFPLQNAQTSEGFSAARLRIARDPRSKNTKIDPTSVRLVLQVDISSNETIEVDLSITGKQIRASVTAPNPLWCQQAEYELPSLEQALHGLGFTWKDSQVCVGETQPFKELDLAPESSYLMTVDIEA